MAPPATSIDTLVLIIILTWSNFGGVVDSLTESVSVESPDGSIAQQREWLLEELNGAHLRLSATVVRCHIDHLKIK